MARVHSFEFASDSSYSDSSSCSIDWTARTVSFPGFNGVAFSQVDELVQVIEDLHSQNAADGIVETSKVVLGSVTGGPDIPVGYDPNATPPTQTIGSATMPSAKAIDLASGLHQFVLTP